MDERTTVYDYALGHADKGLPSYRRRISPVWPFGPHYDNVFSTMIPFHPIVALETLGNASLLGTGQQLA